MPFRPSAFLLLAGLCLAPQVRADDAGASLDEKVAAIVQTGQPALEALAQNKDVVADVVARDQAPLADAAAKAVQALWLAAGPAAPSLKGYLENKSTAAFKAAMRKTPSLAKAFSLDKAGNVVATVPKSHDFVHGFEPKFLDCFKGGKTVVNKPALDLTSKTYSVQISVPVKDGQGATAGVLVGTFAIK
jgi:hypothetical protein